MPVTTKPAFPSFNRLSSPPLIPVKLTLTQSCKPPLPLKTYYSYDSPTRIYIYIFSNGRNFYFSRNARTKEKRLKLKNSKWSRTLPCVRARNFCRVSKPSILRNVDPRPGSIFSFLLKADIVRIGRLNGHRRVASINASLRR